MGDWFLFPKVRHIWMHIHMEGSGYIVFNFLSLIFFRDVPTFGVPKSVNEGPYRVFVLLNQNEIALSDGDQSVSIHNITRIHS